MVQSKAGAAGWGARQDKSIVGDTRDFTTGHYHGHPGGSPDLVVSCQDVVVATGVSTGCASWELRAEGTMTTRGRWKGSERWPRRSSPFQYIATRKCKLSCDTPVSKALSWIQAPFIQPSKLLCRGRQSCRVGTTVQSDVR